MGRFKKILPIIMATIFFLTTYSMPLRMVLALDPVDFSIDFRFNSDENQWEIYWDHIPGTVKAVIRWHDPDGTPEEMEVLTSLNLDGKTVIPFDFKGDYIYDIEAEVQNADLEIIGQGSAWFLAGITFLGTSFNEMAVMEGIEDKSPEGVPGFTDGKAPSIVSGNHPKIRLKWRVPTIYNGSEIQYITDNTTDAGINLLEDGSDIDKAVFQFELKEVGQSIRTKTFTTTASGSSIFIEDTEVPVSGFNADGSMSDEYVEFTLTEEEGIKPGTEYEDVNVKLLFKDSNGIYVPFTKLKTGYKGFPVENKDRVLKEQSGTETSIYTPMEFEVSKVDIDKIEVKIYKIASRNYNELFYQVQDAGNPADLIEQSSDVNTGPKIPDSSISYDPGWGAMIIEIPLNEDGTLPERYYRVIANDGDALTPLGSLAINLDWLSDDTGRPPVPREVEVEPVYAGKETISYGVNGFEKSTQIPLTNLRISMDKPLDWLDKDWETFKNTPEDTDYCYHILLNTYNSDDVKEQETRAIGEDKIDIFMPTKEKRYLVIGKEDMSEDPADPTRLIFTVTGSSLFWDKTTDSSIAFENNEDVNKDGFGNKEYPGDYPDFLVPNTTYYMRIFTARRSDNELVNWANEDHVAFDDKISYISPVISFTTYPMSDMPIPLPNLQLNVNLNEDSSTGVTTLSGITVQFDKILDEEGWSKYTEVTSGRAIYYDIYISESMNEDDFVKIHTIKNTYPDSEPNLPNIYVITGSAITTDGEVINPIKPNTVYYIKSRARLEVNGEEIGRSAYTAVKSITTPKIDLGDISKTDQVPRTPVEFRIAENADGEPDVTDGRVVLKWVNVEPDVTYELVCTTVKLDPDAKEEDYHEDPYNNEFQQVYNFYKTDSDTEELEINVVNTRLSEIGFTYDADTTRVCTLPINLPFMRPNHLYFYSLRAVRNRNTEEEKVSSWVSIPVTTKMVDPPGFLEVVKDVQLGFNVRCEAPGATNEEFELWIKKTTEPNLKYVKLSRSKYSLVRDGDILYWRIYELEPDTAYDIKLYNSDEEYKEWYDASDEKWVQSTQVTPITLKTRDSLHEIEIRWEGDSIHKYGIELRTENDPDYIELQYLLSDNSDYYYLDNKGNRHDFYKEKTNLYVEDGENKYVYYAKILSARVLKPDGSYERQPLKTNTRYLIKVWAKNVEESRHIGPVSIRTDFDQSDYDKNRQKERVIDIYEEKAEQMDEKLYWAIDKENNDLNRILVKENRISNYLEAAKGRSVLLDLSKEKPEASKDEILIPVKAVEMLRESGSKLVIKLVEAEFTLTSKNFNFSEFKKIQENPDIKDVFLKISVERKFSGAYSPSDDALLASKIHSFKMSVIGMNMTYDELNAEINSILNDPEANGPFEYGLIDKKISEFIDTGSIALLSQAELYSMINEVIGEVYMQLSGYIGDRIDGRGGLESIIKEESSLASLYSEMLVKLTYYTRMGRYVPYAKYDGNEALEKLRGIAYFFDKAVFKVKSFGEYSIWVTPFPKIHPKEIKFTNKKFKELFSKYNLKDIFGKDIDSTAYVTGRQAVLLFEVITERQNQNKGYTTGERASLMGLDELLHVNNYNNAITFEQTASLAVGIYCAKLNIKEGDMRFGRTVFISNESEINELDLRRVLLAVGLGIIDLDYSGNFPAKERVKEDTVINVLIKTLELTGDL